VGAQALQPLQEKTGLLLNLASKKFRGVSGMALVSGGEKAGVSGKLSLQDTHVSSDPVPDRQRR
jgi:hypothetical protein